MAQTHDHCTGTTAPASVRCPRCLDRLANAAARRVTATYLESARALAAAVEAKDPHTRRHSVRVSRYAVGLGVRVRLAPARLQTLRVAALLHDIGKIGVPDSVLQKPGPLTREETALVRMHPNVATNILRHASIFDRELPIIRHHHEWVDGSGYPTGLTGPAIPLESRILSVADAIDVMLSSRSYKRRYSIQRVRDELTQCSGSQFDPAVVGAAVRWLEREPERFVQQHVSCP